MLTSTVEIPSAVSEYYDRLLLERALPSLTYELFGQTRPLSKGNSKTIKFRRYESLSNATTPLTEGVPPTSTDPSKTDITAAYKTYGAYIEYTDDVELTSPDALLTEFEDLLGEQAGTSIDILRRDVLTGGTGVTYTNGSARNAVTSIIDLATLRKVRRTLRNNNSNWIREVLSASPKIGTVPIPMSYVAIIHPDVAFDVRNLTGFQGIETYGTTNKIHECEIGAVPSLNMRFLETTQGTKVAGGGGASTSVKNTSSVADVYLTLVFARNAFGIVPLRGNALTNHLKARGSGGTADPLDQVGTIGWKAKTTTVILQDNFMNRVESAASS